MVGSVESVTGVKHPKKEVSNGGYSFSGETVLF